jgi:hypothetical protein
MLPLGQRQSAKQKEGALASKEPSVETPADRSTHDQGMVHP